MFIYVNCWFPDTLLRVINFWYHLFDLINGNHFIFVMFTIFMTVVRYLIVIACWMIVIVDLRASHSVLIIILGFSVDNVHVIEAFGILAFCHFETDLVRKIVFFSQNILMILAVMRLIDRLHFIDFDLDIKPWMVVLISIILIVWKPHIVSVVLIVLQIILLVLIGLFVLNLFHLWTNLIDSHQIDLFLRLC